MYGSKYRWRRSRPKLASCSASVSLCASVASRGGGSARTTQLVSASKPRVIIRSCWEAGAPPLGRDGGASPRCTVTMSEDRDWCGVGERRWWARVWGCSSLLLPALYRNELNCCCNWAAEVGGRRLLLNPNPSVGVISRLAALIAVWLGSVGLGRVGSSTLTMPHSTFVWDTCHALLGPGHALAGSRGS
jgi:hypothetical protein